MLSCELRHTETERRKMETNPNEESKCEVLMNAEGKHLQSWAEKGKVEEEEVI